MFFSLFFSHFFSPYFFFFSPSSLSSFSVFISLRFFFCLSLSLSVYFLPSPLSHYFFPLRNRRNIF
jgi:hypothetical protein